MLYWIGLGANCGDRLASLRGAMVALANDVGNVIARSRLFESAPIGGPDQGPYLNAAALLKSTLGAAAVLKACQAIEGQFGRDRKQELRWGPRLLDLDLLLAGTRGEQLINLPDLEVPHPRLGERAFALAPLVELDPTLRHPITGQPLTALLAAAEAAGQQVVATAEPW